MKTIKESDPKIYNSMKNELIRQRDTVELIASENFVSPQVMAAAGSWLTNKYSEGYPAKRYYGGNEFIDEIEILAIERAKELFGAEHVNVQAHSGSSANIAAFFSILKLGDKILGMSLDHGGHLTHGSKVNFSGKHYNFISYGVEKETGKIDMEEVRRLAIEEKPKLILAGYSAYSRKIDFAKFREIADEVGAYLMADIAHFAGLIVAGDHESPFPHCDIVTTTTHKTLRGPRGAIIMCKTEDRLKEKYSPNSKKNLARKIDSAVFPGNQGGPLDHIVAAKAIAFGEALKPEFKTYIHKVVANSKVLAEELMKYGFKIISDGTDNHLMLIDLTNKNISGKDAETTLDEANITCNKNMVPFDIRSPFDPSGIRIGTAAMTTRGFEAEEFKEVARLMNKVIENWEDKTIVKEVKKEIKELCDKFPLYPGIKLE